MSDTNFKRGREKRKKSLRDHRRGENTLTYNPGRKAELRYNLNKKQSLKSFDAEFFGFRDI
jgi:hypothetical protein